MSKCCFCEGKRIETENCSVIYLSSSHLCFDNSDEEYSEGKIEINYCPFCGKQLEKGGAK